jgi:hypothetical protein
VTGDAAMKATRIPAGHPEGYIEAFAQLYRDAADQIAALEAGQSPATGAGFLTGVDDGVSGHRFIETVLKSHHSNAAWVRL